MGHKFDETSGCLDLHSLIPLPMVQLLLHSPYNVVLLPNYIYPQNLYFQGFVIALV